MLQKMIETHEFTSQFVFQQIGQITRTNHEMPLQLGLTRQRLPVVCHALPCLERSFICQLYKKHLTDSKFCIGKVGSCLIY